MARVGHSNAVSIRELREKEIACQCMQRIRHVLVYNYNTIKKG